MLPAHPAEAGVTRPNQTQRIIGILAFTQVLSWGTVYFAFSVLAPEIQREMQWRPELVYGAFSWSLLVAGLVSTPVGVLLDRHGGRSIMGAGSLIAGAGLIVLGLAKSLTLYFIAWSIIGVAMALVLYEAAFATINREFLTGARKSISTLTLFGGLASTVFWPVTLKFNSVFGWRDTYLVYGLAHFALCLPAHLLLSARPKISEAPAGMTSTERSYSLPEAVRHPVFWKLAFAFATNAFVLSTVSVHLIPLLHRMGHSMQSVVFLASLIGPLQVAGRVGEMVFANKTQPQTVGKITFAMLPAAFCTLILLGIHQWAIALYCALYGLSNGILTIVRGTVPQAIFGRENYGAISGALAGPSLIAKAAGPLIMAALIDMAPSVYFALIPLLVCSLASLTFYLAAVRPEPVASY